MKEDYKSQLKDHSLCMRLAWKYADQMVDEMMKNPPDVKFEELQLYQKEQIGLGSMVAGSSWIKWFIKDYLPKAIEEDNKKEREKDEQAG